MAVGLVAIIAALMLASLAASATLWLTEYNYVFSLVPTFRVDVERSVPTYFSAAILATACVLLAMIAGAQARAGRLSPWPWIVLAGGFAVMSLDEVVGMHERLIVPLRGMLGIEGPSLLHNAWIVVGIAVVAGFGVYFLPFLRQLPVGTRRLFTVAAAIYLGGAIGVEVLGGYYKSLHPEAGKAGNDAFFVYELIVTLEEAMEMLGITAFLYALLSYCGRHLGPVTLQFGSDAAAVPRPDRKQA